MRCANSGKRVLAISTRSKENGRACSRRPESVDSSGLRYLESRKLLLELFDL
jgi:hypothetical protein